VRLPPQIWKISSKKYITTMVIRFGMAMFCPVDRAKHVYYGEANMPWCARENMLI